MKWFLKSFIFFVLFDAFICFNIETREPIVKWSDVPGSYFGFSVAQHETSDGEKWMLVGAPLGKNLQPKTNRSGALFKCPMTQDDRYDCVQVETDGKREPGGKYKFNNFDYDDIYSNGETQALTPPGHDEIKDNQWLGVTVKSQKRGGYAMVCAHRYIQSDRLDLFHYGYGFCYVMNQDLVLEDVLEPCKGRPVQNLHLQYAFCQVGTSLNLLENGMAVMGAPGPLAWKGTIFAKQINGDYVRRDKTLYQGPLENSNITEKYSYLGMSSDGGRFFKKNKITLVSGAPRSHTIGEVIFFDQVAHEPIMDVRLSIMGEQFASSFGYEILAMDIDQDGYDDLLVSAPFYYEEQTYGGAVYVYMKLRECTNEACERTMLKGKYESRFGYSLASLGDINKDGFNDVAIGAPYEGNGVVYIYLGTKTGFQEEPSQVIKSKNFKSLGYSLSAGLDMDNNNYPDLLVGAYESDIVVLYKTRPIIDISIKIDGDLKNINSTKKGCPADPNNRNHTCFSIKCCFSINEDVKNEFKVSYHIEEVLDNQKRSRIWFHDPRFPHQKHHYRNISGINVKRAKRDQCQSETVYVNDGVRDILSPIVFNVKYEVEDDAVNSPILNKTAFQQFEATFQKDCGGDEICESYLVVNAACLGDFPKTEEGYILNLGENAELQIEVNISNTGDAAYEAKLFLTYPGESLSYISLALLDKHDTSHCSLSNDSIVNCTLGNPFPSGKTARIRMRFEVLKNANPMLNFHIFANSTSKELSNLTSVDLRAALQKVADLQLIGKSLTTHVFFGGEIKGESAMKSLEDIGGQVKHRYQISNNGNWTLQNVTVNISWPFQVQSNRIQGKWLLYLESTPQVDDGYCWVDPPSAVNPMKLTSTSIQAAEETERVENVTMAPINFTDNPVQYLKRRKRDAEELLAIPEKLTDSRGNNVVKLSCHAGTAKCVRIYCFFKKLGKDDQKTIDIVSRVWNSTLTEDYSGSDWVTIASDAEILVNDKTITWRAEGNNRDEVETTAYPMVVPPESQVSFWIILISVALGVLLLIFLLFALYKFGFFKRNRVDRTLSGNLKKNGESESLIQINEVKK
ncbi:integrin alpha-PS1 isoform X1 [Coccinella septempunctata]|uniref:integrin alpha-PS1 isoform X1 n=1 Tax=Coccinella septempunctata TaxID=41139 RepID=UPI001D092727|nr:integrin alpha-PS1 isoform X1 [Coccinella septempunctata]